MFKKTLLALALTGMAGTAAAATIVEGGTGLTTNDKIQLVSAEGAVGSSVAAFKNVAFTIDPTKIDDYENLKSITVEIKGATLAAATDAKLASTNILVQKASPDAYAVYPTSVATGDIVPAFDAAYPTSTKVVFSLDAADATEGYYLNTNDGDGKYTTFTISDLVLSLDSIAVGSQVEFTVTATSSVASAKIESESAVISQVIQELSASVKETDVLGKAKIDVEAGRLVFDGDTKTDKVTITEGATTAVDLLGIKGKEEVTYTLNGDFSFLDADGDGVVDKGFTLSGKLADDAQSVSLEDAKIFTFTTEGEVILPAQSFTVDVEYDYKTAAGDSATFTKKGIEAGKWELNGSEHKVGFVPFSSQYARSITVANFGNIDGEITVELNVDGEFQSKVLTATSTKNSIVDISKEVDDFAEELGVTGNAAMKVIVDAPQDNISTDVVYFAKADKDRVKTN